MGCGASKMQSDEEARYRPILRRRLEEFMARRNAGLSKKQLLAGEGILPHEYEADEDMKTTKEDETKDCDNHIFHDTQDCPPIPQKMASTTIIHDNNKVHKINVDDHNGSNVDDHKNVHDHNDSIVDDLNDDKVDDEHKGKDNKGDDDTFEEEKKVHQVSNKETVQEEEAKCSGDDDDDDLEGTEFCPGSPSFRVYCVNNSDEELEDTAENQDFEDSDKQDDEKDCIRQESSNSNVVADEKKQKRRRKFKRISIPKGGKKVLHSMHSFYNFPCNSNNSQLMQQETAPQPKPNVKEM